MRQFSGGVSTGDGGFDKADLHFLVGDGSVPCLFGLHLFGFDDGVLNVGLNAFSFWRLFDPCDLCAVDFCLAERGCSMLKRLSMIKINFCSNKIASKLDLGLCVKHCLMQTVMNRDGDKTQNLFEIHQETSRLPAVTVNSMMQERVHKSWQNFSLALVDSMDIVG